MKCSALLSVGRLPANNSSIMKLREASFKILNHYYYCKYYYYYYYLHVRVGVNHASMIHNFAYAEHDKQDYDRGKKVS